MTKERLEELIEQGASVWYANGSSFFNFNLTDSFLDNNGILKSKIGEHCWVEIKNLYETKDQAEHALKYTRIPKTEYLDLPYYEDFVRLCKNGNVVEFYKQNNYYIVYLWEDKTINIQKTVYGKLYEDTKLIFTENDTKENYTKACEIAKKLWLEEIV